MDYEERGQWGCFIEYLYQDKTKTCADKLEKHAIEDL